MKFGSHAGVVQVSPVRLVCIGRWEVDNRSFQGEPISLAGVYRTGTEAVQRAGWGGVDVALIDDRLPDLDTFNCLQRISQQAPLLRLLVACEALQEEPAMLWLAAGAAGCVAKSSSTGELARACLLAFHVGVYLPPALFRKTVRAIQKLRLISRLGSDLTPREVDTLLGVMLGQSNKDLSARLGVDVGTAGRAIDCMAPHERPRRQAGGGPRRRYTVFCRLPPGRDRRSAGSRNARWRYREHRRHRRGPLLHSRRRARLPPLRQGRRLRRERRVPAPGRDLGDRFDGGQGV